MGSINRFQDLEVWQQAHRLVLAVYRQTERYPAEERYGLVAQMRRAAVSVPANIAEGFKRRGKNEKVRFYNISEASLEELKYFLILSEDLGYFNDTKQLMEDAETVSRMLHGLIQSIERRR
jgi:four helix bundle protein